MGQTVFETGLAVGFVGMIGARVGGNNDNELEDHDHGVDQRPICCEGPVRYR